MAPVEGHTYVCYQILRPLLFRDTEFSHLRILYDRRCSVRVRTDQSSHKFGVEALLGHLLRKVAPELRRVLVESKPWTKPVEYFQSDFKLFKLLEVGVTCQVAGNLPAVPGLRRLPSDPLTSSRIVWCKNRRCPLSF